MVTIEKFNELMVELSAEDVRNEIEIKRDEWSKDYDVLPIFLEVALRGKWLHERLKVIGVDDVTAEKMCFALGQRLAMNISDMNKVAADVWNRFVEGHVDEPGRKLALELIEEWSNR